MNFDVNVAHFGKIETIELVKGGSTKEVTIQNRQQFVSKMYQWNLTGEQTNMYDIYVQYYSG